MPKQDVGRDGNRRRERPFVAVSLGTSQNIWPRLLARARELEWQLVNLRYSGSAFPKDIVIQGAIVDALPGTELVQRLGDLGCPTVRYGRFPHPCDRQVPAVMGDRFAEGRLAARYFAERGFKHLAYVGSDPLGDYTPLYNGMKEAADELGCECHLLQQRRLGEARTQDLYQKRLLAFADWVKGLPKPLGLLGFVDSKAAEFCRMCTDAGFAVPDEIAILGRTNATMTCETCYPALSSIQPDYDGECDRLVEMLQDLINGRKVSDPCVKVPPLGVVTRASTDILATPDRKVAQAIRYIWDHFDLDVAVNDVSEAVGLPARTLTRRFRQAIGRSIIQELHRKRLEEAKRLLRTTEMSVADVACAIGFRSDDYLYRTFRRAFGITPRRYRIRKDSTAPNAD